MRGATYTQYTHTSSSSISCSRRRKQCALCAKMTTTKKARQEEKKKAHNARDVARALPRRRVVGPTVSKKANPTMAANKFSRMK